MSDFIACYRSSAPDVIAAWESYGEDRKRFAADLDALTAELWPEKVQNHQPEPIVTISSFDPGKRRLVGWSWPWGAKPPEGWKVEKGPEYYQTVSPKRTSKEGKAIAKRMDAVRPVASLDLPGMPLSLLLLPASYSPAVEHHGGAFYVGWGTDVEAVDPRSTPGGKPLDLEKWERIKVSEFFAAREDDPEYAKDAS